ncbi:PA2169 family four-helix-bundle protein [Bacillus shivajii]|uniref:DUF2383 domain-containing protein n=1 Tax=Bacillus shivajii TaxID=1983719 RepID=UPI001CFC1D1E|nr:DUF2383 domain-containing protein [Bacillus shivajii]UCZ55085.1 PA2169 family four-helix-bundle protein [Bacillus shivajii]
MEHHVIDELNSFLEGNFMAIHAYENYIEHIDDANLKAHLQELQEDHKQHAEMIAKRIQTLGGVPVDDVGLKGTIAEFVVHLKGVTKENSSILKDALVGEKRGIKKSKQILSGDLDHESLELVKDILNEDEKHIDLLSEMIDNRE